MGCLFAAIEVLMLIFFSHESAIAYLNGSDLPDEYRLIHDKLLTNYDPSVRPRFDSMDNVKVNVRFSLQQIYDLDEKRQILTISGWLTAEWVDEFLKWDPKDYGGLESFVITPKKIWTPLLAIGNSATKMFQNWRHFWVTVRHDGKCRWQPGGNFAFTCRLDMNYYPFDSQSCTMEVETWFYSDDKVRLHNIMTKFGLETYLQNGEWEVCKTEVKQVNKTYEFVQGEQFPEIFFTIHIKRKYTFHFMYIMLPCIMLSFVLLMVFLLPAESGEKVNLGVSILVSFSVFLLIVSEKVPDTSDAVPVMAIYLMYFMLGTALSVVFSTLVLKLHYHGHETSAPPWLHTLVFDLLAPVLCLRSLSTWGKNRRLQDELLRVEDARKLANPLANLGDTKTKRRNGSSAKDAACSHVEGQTITDRSPLSAEDSNAIFLMTTNGGDLGGRYHCNCSCGRAACKKLAQDRIKADRIGEEWKRISQVVDRLLFWLFFAFLTIPLISLIAFVQSSETVF